MICYHQKLAPATGKSNGFIWPVWLPIVATTLLIVGQLHLLGGYLALNVSNVLSLKVVESKDVDVLPAISAWSTAIRLWGSRIPARNQAQALALLSAKAGLDESATLLSNSLIAGNARSSHLNVVAKSALAWYQGDDLEAVNNGRAADVAPLLLILAGVRERHGDTQAALLMRERATKVDPFWVTGWLELATLHERLGQWEAAKLTYEAGIERNPNSALLYREYGYLLRTQCGANDLAAETAWLTAERLQPEDEQTRLFLALLYLQTGRPQLGLEEAKAVIEINPHRAAGYWYLGSALLALGHPKPALENLEKAVNLGEANPWVFIDLARAYKALGDCLSARGVLRTLQSRDPHFGPGQDLLRILDSECY